MKEDTKALAEEIVYWILLTDQWPFRMCYMLQVIEDADQREFCKKQDEVIEDDVTLLEIFERYELLNDFCNEKVALLILL